MDRLLILRSAADPGRWQLPGGLVEAGESPLDAVRREAREEIGLELDVRETDLMAVEWVRARRPGRRDRLALVFAGPRLGPEEAACVRLQRREVAEHRWELPTSALTRLHPRLAARVRGPLQLPGPVLYRETPASNRTLTLPTERTTP
jgi:8-oxo-dGTP pyrophosphatase MutT (NUDIX family)